MTIEKTLLSQLESEIDQEKKGNILFELAASCHKINRYKMMDYATKALDYVNDENIKAKCQMYISAYYLEIQNIKKSFIYLLKAKPFLLDTDYKFQIMLNSSLGWIHSFLNRHEEAYLYYIKSLHIADEQNLPAFKMTSLNNLSILFMDTKKHRNAIKHSEEAIRLAKELANPEMFIFMFSNHLLIHLDLNNNPENSLEPLLDELEEKVAIHNLIGMTGHCMCLRGLFYRNNNSIDLAIKKFELAIDILTEENQLLMLFGTYSDYICTLYANNQIEKAKEAEEYAVNLINEMEFELSFPKFFKSLYEFFFEHGNPIKGNMYKEKYDELMIKVSNEYNKILIQHQII